jgi:NADPH-dependent 2,4-dienoyl-CoA reductase/sulfur reductase-like enzyme
MNVKEVTLLFPSEAVCDRVFPPEISKFVTDFYRKKGVQIRNHAKVSGLERQGENLMLKFNGGQQIAVDGVVAGIGVEPNVQLAKTAGLAVDNGIIVDKFLHADGPDVYAAGDVAAFPCQALGKRVRVEHEDNANAMGKQAGRNMAGKSEAYAHLPSFYSDLFELGYEAVGDLDARLETYIDWKEPFKEGVIYYLEKDQVRGVLLWNVWGQVDAARQLISESKPVRTEDLRGRLKST